MDKSRIFFNNIANDTAFTIAATTEETTYDKENALDNTLKNKWRSTSQVNQYFTLTSSTTYNIRGVYIGNTNVTSADTIQLQTSDDNFGSTDETQALTLVTRSVYEKSDGILTRTDYTDAYGMLDASRQDFRIFINRAAGSYVEFGKIYLFLEYEDIGKGFNFGASMGRENVFSRYDGAYGIINKNLRYQRNIWLFDYTGIHGSLISTMTHQIGANDFVVWIPYGLDTPMYFGTMEFSTPILMKTKPNDAALEQHTYNLSGSFTEAL